MYMNGQHETPHKKGADVKLCIMQNVGLSRATKNLILGTSRQVPIAKAGKFSRKLARLV